MRQGAGESEEEDERRCEGRGGTPPSPRLRGADTCIVMMSARVLLSIKCARLRSLKNSSIAARTAPVVRPVLGSLGSQIWCM